jgi:putative drug exporter of the RND superfamily
MGMRWASVITSRGGALLIVAVTVALGALVWLSSPAQPAAQPDDGLPAGKQSTRVTELEDRFPSARSDAAVVVYERAGGPLTAADRGAIAAAGKALAAQAPVFSPDRRAALLVVPVAGNLDDAKRATTVDGIRRTASGGPADPLPAGLTAQVTGGPAFARDVAAAFDGADVTLLLATSIVVALLLLITYRSPILWIAPLAVIGVADQLVAKLLPWVARIVGERTDAAVSGIVSVLVFGAGTDYALLLISRYREELRRTPEKREAMTRALRGAAPAILGSAATVVLALLTLLAAVLTSNRTLGISAALGVVVALLFGLVVLPAVLAGLPRAVFWPFVPTAGSPEPSETGLWARIARGVSRRPAAVLVIAVLLLGALATGLSATRIGLSQTEQFRTKVQSVTAQEALARHFPAGSSQPVIVISTSASVDAVTARMKGVDGVAAIGRTEKADDGRLARTSAELTAGPGTPEADRTVRELRAALTAVPGAGALVGGAPAADLDQRDANVRDDKVIVPLVLAVVLLVLILLLRSLLAPVLLLLTVMASFAASLGAATLVLTHLLDLPHLDASVPLLSFLFLVALGVDYNIFLVTRAREETKANGETRTAMVRALGATGGVITSAGILLAAVFTVLGVLPVIVLTQIGVIVGIGVLLDTLLVRTVVVPAIALLLGERFWWPARPADHQARG